MPPLHSSPRPLLIREAGPFFSSPNPSSTPHGRRPPQLRCRRRFAALGWPPSDSSRREHLLPLLGAFPSSPGLICLPTGPPPCRFAAPPPLSVAPPPRRRSSPASPPVSLTSGDAGEERRRRGGATDRGGGAANRRGGGPAGEGKGPGEEGNGSRRGRRCSPREESVRHSPRAVNRRRRRRAELAAAAMVARVRV